MSGIPIRLKEGPATGTPAEAINGGQIVEARAASRVGVAAAGSLKALGVALVDGINPEAVTGTAATVDGRPVLSTVTRATRIGIAYGGMEVPVTYSAAAAFGDKLIVGATPGQAAPAGLNPDARSIVGTCTEPAGVAAGAVGRMRTV